MKELKDLGILTVGVERVADEDYSLEERYTTAENVVKEGGVYLHCLACKYVYALHKNSVTDKMKEECPRPISEKNSNKRMVYYVDDCPVCEQLRWVNAHKESFMLEALWDSEEETKIYKGRSR